MKERLQQARRLVQACIEDDDGTDIELSEYLETANGSLEDAIGVCCDRDREDDELRGYDE